MLLEGGLDWKTMGLSPREMDFVEARNGAARDIALALGVPPMLLGIPGDNTYANYSEANRAFYRLTVLPLLARTAAALGNWLAPVYGGGLRLAHDTDAIAGPRRRTRGAVEAHRRRRLPHRRGEAGSRGIPAACRRTGGLDAPAR